MIENLPQEFRIKTSPAEIWAEYEIAKNYNYGSEVDLYKRVKMHERFVSGDQ